MRVGDTEERGQHNGVTRGCGSFQKRFKRRDRSVRPVQNHFQSASQKPALFFISSRLWLHFVEQTPGMARVRFVEVQLRGAKLRPEFPSRFAKKFGEFLQGFVSSVQPAQHFRLAKNRLNTKRRALVEGHVPIE